MAGRKAMQLLRMSGLILSACLATSTMAHTVWLEAVEGQPEQFRVRFGGHAGALENYDSAKLKSVDAKDANGRALAVSRMSDADGVVLRIDGAPVAIIAHFDNGIFSYVSSGRSFEKPMNEVPGATRATHAVKYHKTVLAWSAATTQAWGQPFEVVPLDARAPRANQPMRVQVLMNGQPLAGVRLGRGEEGGDDDPVTNDNGIAIFLPRPGFNKLWAGKRYPIEGNPRFTQLSYEYLLGFTAE